MRYKGTIFKAVLIILFGGILAWLVFKFRLYNKHGYRAIGNFISSFGPFSAVIYIAFFTVRTLLLVIPYWFMVVLSGRLYGSVFGFIYSMIAVFLASSLAYFISRYLGKDFVEKLLKGRIQQLDEKAESHGFKIVLIMRLSSVFPFDILNYAIGLTKIKYKDFILGSMIGIIPETFSLTFMGSSLLSPKSGRFAIAIAMIILTMGVPFIYKKITNRKKVS